MGHSEESERGGENFCLYEHFSDLDLETFKCFNVLILYESLCPSLCIPDVSGLLYSPPHTSQAVFPPFGSVLPLCPSCRTLYIPTPAFRPLSPTPCLLLVLLTSPPWLYLPNFWAPLLSSLSSRFNFCESAACSFWSQNELQKALLYAKKYFLSISRNFTAHNLESDILPPLLAAVGYKVITLLLSPHTQKRVTNAP